MDVVRKGELSNQDERKIQNNEVAPESKSEKNVCDGAHFQFSQEPSLESIRQMMSNFALERDWQQYHTPRNLLLALVGEVGEAAELFQWREQVSAGLPDWSDEEKNHLGQELSDILLYLIRLADRCHIDLPKAAINKLALNAIKYPAVQVRGSSRKYTEYKNSTGSCEEPSDKQLPNVKDV